MKIVQLTTDNRNQYGHTTLPEPYFGTAPTGLLDGFAGMPGVEVHVVSCASVKMETPDKLADNLWFHQPLVSKIGWGRTLFQGCVRAVRGLMDEIQPDIVHGQGTERDCALAAVLSGYPNVLTIHGNMRVHSARPENRKNVYYKMAAMLETFSLRRSGGVVAISRYTENLVKGLTPRTWLLPNAVDRRYFDIEPAAPALPRILFVGSIDERKNPLGLIRACEPMLRAGECTLALAGQGNREHPYVKEVYALAETIPSIEMLGFIGRDELGGQFKNSSLVVLPTFEDNCPMVVLEAMAAGLPVAASRVGGVPDLVAHEADGLMFDPHDAEEVRASLERLVRAPSLRADLAARGRKKALERFHPRVIAEEHLKIYREVLGW
jgi:glycosyltransferase involved in cell wall biosynthesis